MKLKLRLFFSKLCRPFVRFWERLCNGLAYFKFGWKNGHDWDFHYFLKLLDFKLNRLKKFYSDEKNTNMIASEASKIVSQISFAQLYLEKMITSNYCDELYAAHDAVWGSPELEFEDVENGYSKLNINRKNVKTDDDYEQERSEYRKLMEHEQRIKEQCYETFFMSLAKNLDNWWD